MTTTARKLPLIPARAWLAKYDRAWLRPDIVAGLAAGAVVIPKAMAYAAIAGLPLQVGLYTACLPMVVYALLGTSRVLSVSSTSTIAILGATAWPWPSPGRRRPRPSPSPGPPRRGWRWCWCC